MLSNLIKGIIIAVSMLIPGVSGGTTALMCGIYYKLIDAIDSFFENPKENLRLLLSVAIGGIIGILVFSKIIHLTYSTFRIPMLYLFMGAVLGSIPLLVKSSGVRKINYKTCIYPIIGVLVVILLGIIPKDLFVINANGLFEYFMIFFIGIFLATALVLPGISFTYMLLILGLYEQTLAAIENFNITFLFAMGTGVILGVFLTVKVIRIILRKYPQQTYLVIIGFVLASLRDVFPGIPNGSVLIVSIILFLLSFFTIYKVSDK